MNLSYTKKTVIGLGSLSLLCLLAGLSAFVSNRLILSDLSLFADRVLPATDYLLQLDRDLQQALVAERTMFEADDKRALKNEALENIGQVEERWQKFRRSISEFETPAIRSLATVFEKGFDDWASQAKATLNKLESSNEEVRLAAIQHSLTTGSAAFDKARGSIDELTSFLEKQSVQLNADAKATANLCNWLLVGLAIIAVGLGFLITWNLGIRIGKKLSKIADELHGSADRASAAALEITTSSQRVAEGASEQAASLQETSSALDSSAVMIKTNAQSAARAKSLSELADKAAQDGYAEMKTMVQAMTEIQESSDNIASTLKTIDEISFQTNILALNAAVEAARAGEAGAGFAVVADEVRALAQRCAEAARDTSEKIEESVARSNKGMETSQRVSQKLSEILERVSEMDELMAGIARSSDEQSESVSRLHSSMEQMDVVTQANAASAEETASSANELSSQADSLYRVVEELGVLLNIETEKAFKPLSSRGSSVNSPSFSPPANRSANSFASTGSGFDSDDINWSR